MNHFSRIIISTGVFFLAFALTCFLSNTATAGTRNETLSAIKGKVITSDGQPAQYVSVQIRNTNRGVQTDQNGEFVFKKIQPGKYTLQISLVGYENLEQEVTVLEDQIAAVTLQLTASDSQLKEVIVKGGRNKYKVDEVSNSLRLQTPLLEVPQNIQVVSAQLIADQQVFDMVEGVTRNVSGASRSGHWDNQYANIRMRGSKIPAFRNGMNIEASWGPTAEDMSQVERIEFVKGPAGFMLANGEPGGFYNVVTKKPTGITKGSVNLSMGSFSTYRAALDFDGKLSKDGKLLYRLNLMGQQKDMYVKYNFNNRYLINPSFKYIVDDRTSITLEYTYQTSKYLENGTYFFSKNSIGDKQVPHFFTYGDPSLDPGRLKDQNVFAYLEHKLNNKWQFNAQVAYFNFEMVSKSIWPSEVLANGDMKRAFSVGDEAGENRFAQFSFKGEEKTGAITHRILGGVDMGNKKFWGDFRQFTPNLRLGGGQVFNIYNPVYGIPFDSIPKIDRSRSIRARAGQSTYITSNNYTSVYAQDELSFFNNKLRVSLAGRFTHSETVGKTNAANIKDNVFTPRAGISYSVDKSTAVYALHDQSYVPVAGTDFYGNVFTPIMGKNTEIGIKREWFGGRWVSSVTVYRIVRENALVADTDPTHIVNGRNFQIQAGETQSKGVEADVNGEIIPGLNVSLNYALTDSKITEDGVNPTVKQKGNVTPGTATHINNGWLTYRIQRGALEGIGASFGYQWQAGRHVGTTQTPNLRNYFRTDAGVSYQKGKYNIALLVNNLGDDRYLFTTASGTAATFFTYIVEPKRNFRINIGYRF